MKTNRGNIMVSTTIETKDGWTRMVYHGTCVAEYKPTETVEQIKVKQVRLNTGGFFTKTTKKRMNQFAEMFGIPARVFCERGQGYTDFPGTDSVPKRFSGNTCEFTVQT